MSAISCSGLVSVFIAMLFAGRIGASLNDVCENKQGGESCDVTKPSLLDEFFAELLISSEDATKLKRAGYALVSDLEDATVDELMADGVNRVVAKKLVREITK
eukprot:gene27862-23569_t